MKRFTAAFLYNVGRLVGAHGAKRFTAAFVANAPAGGGVSADPGEANVLTGVSYMINDVAKTGTFDEAARNVGTSEENILVGNSIKIRGADTVGTFNEAARNTDPGEANVLHDVAYKIAGTDKTGSLGAAIIPSGSTGSDTPPEGTTFSFYVITTVSNNLRAETLLISDVKGKIELQSSRKVDGENINDVELSYTFYPFSIVAGIARGNKVVDSTGNIYELVLVESYGSHQEITLRKKIR